MDAFELFRSWWADVPTRHGPNTARTYRGLVFRFFADTPTDPTLITARQLDKALGEMIPRHAKQVRTALGDFFAFLVRRGYRLDNPLEATKRPKPGRQRVKRGWTEDEMERVLDASGRVDPSGRLAWAILAQYGLCLRPGEFVSLTADKVVLNGASSCVYLTDTKTGNDRAVPVVATAREALEKLLVANGGCRVVPFGRTQYWSKVRLACQTAGLAPEKCRPYALRHTGATHLLERGVNIRVVAEILGHTDLRHTMTYTQPSSADLRTALAKLG